MMQRVVIDGESLDVRSVHAVAEGASVALAPTVAARMEATNRIVSKIVEDGAVAYGITTGFGRMSDVAIPHDRLADLQVNLVRSHASGVGPLLAEREVRAMMLLRANVLAKGFSGSRPHLAELLVGMLNAHLYPPVPEQGSVGASGDLAPLAHLALSLIGEGELRAGERSGPAAAMLAAASLEPIVLGPKEGITLINGTQTHTAIGALALHQARLLWRTAHVAGAATLDALRGTPTAFDARIHDARGQSGQIISATLLRALTEGSQIRESHRHGDPRVQDAYALRCMPQVHGPVWDAIEFAGGVIGRELNAATDNPLVFENGEVISGGNFHGQAVGLVLDVLAIALTNLATMSERRIDRLVNPELNEDLPAFLVRDAGLNSGFMMAQVTAASLASECKVLAHPATVDTIPTDGNKEDVVPMSMGAAWKLRRVVDNVRHVLAIELMCAAQALDFRAPLRSSPPIQRVHAALRALVTPLDRDRVLSHDIQSIATALGRGDFAAEEIQ
jgi:histidine ammonia-lyase